MNNNLDNEQLLEFGKVVRVHHHQISEGQTRSLDIKNDLQELSIQNENQSKELDELLLMAEQLINTENDININTEQLNQSLNEIDKNFDSYLSNTKKYNPIITTSYSSTWEKYISDIDDYSQLMHINLSKDPFDELMSKEEQQEIINNILKDYKVEKPNLDKYDYMFAAISGILCGLIDVFFVGGLSKSKIPDKIVDGKLIKGSQSEIYHLEKGSLGEFTDEKTNRIIEKFGKYIYEKDKKAGKLVKNTRNPPSTTKGWIGYLEERFKVPYDARTAKDLNKNYSDLRLSPSNHHLKSLAHQPDILGLFFSILDQFNNTTSVIDKGKIQIIKNPSKDGKSPDFQLQGTDIKSKLFCGVVNWLGHLISDMGGSSSSKSRGQGIPMPFYSLLQLFDFNLLKDDAGEPISIAILAETVYMKGIDFRMGAAQAIPVILNEIFIRFFWTLKEICYNKKPFKEIIKINTSSEIRRLLLVGHGSFCAVDGLDAYIRSGGGNDPIIFLGRLNLVGWCRFGISAYKEFLTLFNAIDYERLDKDIEEEWKKIYKSSFIT